MANRDKPSQANPKRKCGIRQIRPDAVFDVLVDMVEDTHDEEVEEHRGQGTPLFLLPLVI